MDNTTTKTTTASSLSDLVNCEPFSHSPSEESIAKKLFDGAYNVLKDGMVGAVDEITHHPMQVLQNVAIGAGIEVAASALSPAIAAGVAAAGVGYLGYEVYENSSKYLGDLAIVSGRTCATDEEIDAAHADLQQTGRSAVDFAAGLAGAGLAFKAVRSAVEKAILPPPSANSHPTLPEVEFKTSDGGQSSGMDLIRPGLGLKKTSESKTSLPGAAAGASAEQNAGRVTDIRSQVQELLQASAAKPGRDVEKLPSVGKLPERN